MVKSVLPIILIPYALGMRMSQDSENLMRTDGELDLPDAHGVQAFTCPPECLECCVQLRSLTGVVSGYFQRRDSFKCITRVRDNVTSIPNHNCEEPIPRSSSSWEEKRACRFTHPERRGEAWRALENCRDTHTLPYEDFLGVDSCSVTYTGRFISRRTGWRHFGFARAGIDALLLTDNHAVAGGVCNFVGGAFADGGLLPDGLTEEESTAGICQMLEEDLNLKRLDTFAMAVWAASVGPLTPFNMTTPSEPTQILHKFQIPGWKERSVSYQTLEDDMKQLPVDDGYTSPMLSMTQCTMLRLRGLPMEDDFDSDGNQWGNGCEDPASVLHRYYDRWGIYQRPHNFAFPQNEITSDRILEQMVFQNVGSHKLELLNALDGHDAAFISPVGLGGCGNGALPVTGCPIPLQSALAAVPERVRRSLKFALRMEGLFDDVHRRKHAGKWGSNAFFDGDGHLRAIQYEGRTLIAGEGDNDWDYFKFVFRSSLVSTITSFDHLVATHILAAETLAVAAIENLGPNNKLRMLINPHIVGSLSINFNAALNLFPQGILIHRASPFAGDAFQDATGPGTNGKIWAKTVVLRYTKFEDTYRTYRQFFEELRSEGIEMPELPFFEDGLLIHTEIRRYVDAAIDLIYGSTDFVCNAYLRRDVEAQRFLSEFWTMNDAATPDFWPQEFRAPTCHALKDWLTEIIFMVTGWHRHVGTVADFFRDTRLASTVWKEGETNTRPKHATMMMLLAATTNAILPKFTHELSEQIYGDHTELADNFKTLNSRMLEVQGEIEQRNQVRQGQNFIPYHNMEPESIEWGVEV